MFATQWRKAECVVRGNHAVVSAVLGIAEQDRHLWCPSLLAMLLYGPLSDYDYLYEYITVLANLEV